MSSSSVPVGKGDWNFTVDRPPYTLKADEVAQRLQVDIQQGTLLSIGRFDVTHLCSMPGLSERIVEGRQREFGVNQVQSDEASSWGSILLGSLSSFTTGHHPLISPWTVGQIANAMVLVLVMGMVVSFAIKSWIEGGVVAAVVRSSPPSPLLSPN